MERTPTHAQLPNADEDELLACERCGRTPDDEQHTWRVHWGSDRLGRDVLVAICPDCARGELDD